MVTKKMPIKGPMACASCGGTGKKFGKACASCGGTGKKK
jgi:DnaJ-class molecular chaperone